ncbi:hypothetical protein ES702_02670 [subsurface metagenome]
MRRVRYEDGVITCICPVCNAVTNFHDRTRGGQQLGFFLVDKHHYFGDTGYAGIYYQLFSCAGCGRGGIAEIHYYHRNDVRGGELGDFYPVGIEKAKVPEGVPKSILAELREAERCASVGAWRAGSAMLRSVLEKVFEGNGYTKGVLKDKINESNKDGIITDSRAKKAHDDVRALGNDILHDEWKEVTNKDFVTAYHYCQRVIEDFYDERDIVSRILEEKGRVKTGNK